MKRLLLRNIALIKLVSVRRDYTRCELMVERERVFLSAYCTTFPVYNSCMYRYIYIDIYIYDDDDETMG